MLPSDDSAGGFDNNADVLGVSPVLLESYLTAAERVGRAGARRSEAAAGRRGVPGPAGRIPGQARRGHADRDRRRTGAGSDAAARRRVPVRGQAVPDQPRHDARPRVPAPARDRRGRRARAPGLVRRRQGDRGVEREPDHDRQRRRRPVHRPSAAQSRSAAHHDCVHREDARAQHAAAAELRAQLVRHDRLLGLPAHRSDHLHRPVQSDRPRRYAEPAPHLRLPARGRGATRRPAPRRISEHARAPRLSRRLHRRRSARAARLLPPRPRRWQDVRVGHRPGAAPAAGQPEVRLPRRARPRRRGGGRASTR